MLFWKDAGFEARDWRLAIFFFPALKEKRPFEMIERPKSREETPKEGSGTASRRSYRTATI
jgi:hypothetical protein